MSGLIKLKRWIKTSEIFESVNVWKVKKFMDKIKELLVEEERHKSLVKLAVKNKYPIINIILPVRGSSRYLIALPQYNSELAPFTGTSYAEVEDKAIKYLEGLNKGGK